ncbi:MAG: hypothetical protein COU69_03955 [Candidatus Pacebacteria bacterium CG10_big_fil_rev_8_21_14_0_10_56_10]|nr:MAG: hypothetical protein COU69_03955 [Candidatus Pacebacteria bacterium CG10_big_fil_rev_8_21_14_0_10_56_10]
MSRSTLSLIAILTVLASALGFNYFFQPFAELDLSKLGSPEAASTEQSPSPAPDQGQDSDPAATAVSELTPPQKIAQLMAVPWVLADQASATQAALLAEFQPGMVTLFGEQLSRQLVDTSLASLSARIGAGPDRLAPLIAVDHEGGAVQRLAGQGFARLPSWQEVCSQQPGEMAQTVAAAARQLQAAEIDVVFAPVVDVAENHPVLGDRICDADPLVVTERSFQASNIYQQHGVLPVIKHFPGIGRTGGDLHRRFETITVTPEAAQPFRGVLEQLPDIGVMVTHVGVANQQPEVPCSLSFDCVNQLKQNFPEVLVFADALDMSAAAHQPPEGADQQAAQGTAQGTDQQADQPAAPKSLAQISQEAILAGNDVLVYGLEVTLEELETVKQQLAERYQNSPIFRLAVDDRLERLVNFKLNRKR